MTRQGVREVGRGGQCKEGDDTKHIHIHIHQSHVSAYLPLTNGTKIGWSHLRPSDPPSVVDLRGRE